LNENCDITFLPLPYFLLVLFNITSQDSSSITTGVRHVIYEAVTTLQ